MTNRNIHVQDTLLSDMSKDAYGVRLRNYQEWWTQEELDAEYDHLQKMIFENIQEDEKRHKLAKHHFEDLIQRVIRYGAGSRGNALRWLKSQADIGFEHYLWEQDLSFKDIDVYMKEAKGL